MFEVVENIKSKILSSFNTLGFEESTHTYIINNVNPESVSNCVKQFYEQFDARGNADRMAMGDKVKADALIAKWDKIRNDSCDLGHRVHAFGEKYFYDKTLQPLDGYELGIIKWWKSLPSWVIPVLAETKVYWKNIFAGTFDVTLWDLKSNGLIIADYKTNADLFKNFKNKKMLPPFQFLLDTPFNHYVIQQSYYQIPLEDIGIPVIDRWLVHLKQDGTFVKHNLIDYTKHLRKYYDNNF
jgi:hypothetical protein